MRRPSLLAAFALGFGLGLVGLAPPAAAQTAAATMPQLALPYADFTLPNGLRVLLHVDHRTPDRGRERLVPRGLEGRARGSQTASRTCSST
jgi:hypothetical protein